MYWFGTESLKTRMWAISAWQGAVNASKSRQVIEFGTPKRHNVNASSELLSTLKKFESIYNGIHYILNYLLFLVQVQNSFCQLHKRVTAEKTDLCFFFWGIFLRQRCRFTGMSWEKSPIFSGGLQPAREGFYLDIPVVTLAFLGLRFCSNVQL